MSIIRTGLLSPAERLELEACVRRQREDHGIARRANAMLLLDDGKSCQAISEFLYLDDDTIRGWYKTYREGGWDALALNGWKGGHSQMTQAEEAALCVWLGEGWIEPRRSQYSWARSCKHSRRCEPRNLRYALC